MSFVKEFQIILPILFFENMPSQDSFYLILFLLFLYDIFFGIVLKIIECFLSNKIILSLSICIPFVFLKMIISSFFHVIPFLDDEIIININKGELFARIIILLIGHYYKYHKYLIVINWILLASYIPISFISIIFIIIYYYKLEDLKKEEESNTIIKYEYFSENFLLNYLLFINYSINFSTVPLYIIKFFGKQFLIAFCIGDIIGRYLSSSTKHLNETHYKPIIFFRFFYCIYLKFTFDGSLIHSFLLGILSGSLTFIGYSIPVNYNC